MKHLDLQADKKSCVQPVVSFFCLLAGDNLHTFQACTMQPRELHQVHQIQWYLTLGSCWVHFSIISPGIFWHTLHSLEDLVELLPTGPWKTLLLTRAPVHPRHLTQDKIGYSPICPRLPNLLHLVADRTQVPSIKGTKTLKHKVQTWKIARSTFASQELAAEYSHYARFGDWNPRSAQGIHSRCEPQCHVQCLSMLQCKHSSNMSLQLRVQALLQFCTTKMLWYSPTWHCCFWPQVENQQRLGMHRKVLPQLPFLIWVRSLTMNKNNIPVLLNCFDHRCNEVCQLEANGGHP